MVYIINILYMYLVFNENIDNLIRFSNKISLWVRKTNLIVFGFEKFYFGYLHEVFLFVLPSMRLISMGIQFDKQGRVLFSVWCGVFTYFDGVAFRVLECECFDVELLSLMDLLSVYPYANILEMFEPGLRVTYDNL